MIVNQPDPPLRKLLCGAAHIKAAVGLGRERRLSFWPFGSRVVRRAISPEHLLITVFCRIPLCADIVAKVFLHR
jgi:hypothetical protein